MANPNPIVQQNNLDKFIYSDKFITTLAAYLGAGTGAIVAMSFILACGMFCTPLCFVLILVAFIVPSAALAGMVAWFRECLPFVLVRGITGAFLGAAALGIAGFFFPPLLLLGPFIGGAVGFLAGVCVHYVVDRCNRTPLAEFTDFELSSDDVEEAKIADIDIGGTTSYAQRIAPRLGHEGLFEGHSGGAEEQPAAATHSTVVVSATRAIPSQHQNIRSSI